MNLVKEKQGGLVSRDGHSSSSSISPTLLVFGHLLQVQRAAVLCKSQVDQYCSLGKQSETTSADPEGGTGEPDPPCKITSYMGFYRE